MGTQNIFVIQSQPAKYIREPKHIYSFDEAVSLAGNGKFQLFLLLITGICLMSVIVETAVVGQYITQARCDLQFTYAQQGILSSAAYFGVVVSSYFWGFISDTWGRLNVLKFSTFGGLVFSLISAFSNSVEMLIAFRFIVGLFIAGSQGCVFSYLGEFHGAKTRTKAVTLLSAFVTLGLTFAPALGIGLLPLEFGGEIYGKPFASWRVYGIIASTPSVLVLIILLFMPESPKYLLNQGKANEALDVLRLTYRINKNQPRENFPVEMLAKLDNGGHSTTTGILDNIKKIWTHTMPMFARERIFTSLNLLFQMFGIYLVSHGSYMWFPTIMAWMVEHIDDNLTMYEIITMEIASKNSTITCVETNVFTYEVLTAMGVFFTLSYIVIGLLIKKVGKKPLLCFWLLISGLAGLSLYWASGFYLCAVMFMLFIGTGNSGGIVCTIAVDYFPTQISALAMCLIMLIGRLGVVVGSNMYSPILQANPNILFYGLGSFVLCLALLSLLLPGEKKKKVDNVKGTGTVENAEDKNDFDTKL